MKKRNFVCTFLLVLAIDFLCFSCVIFVPEPDSKPVDSSRTFSMKFCNDSRYDVSDWYLKSEQNVNYVKSSNEFYPVDAYSSKYIYNLPCQYYTVWFSFRKNPGKNDYWRSSSSVLLNSNKKYYLKNWYNNEVSDYFGRSVASTDFDLSFSEENIFYLEDEDGNCIEFVKDCD